MLLYAYIFGLIVGGVLLGVSVFAGGDHGDASHDTGDHDHAAEGHGEAGSIAGFFMVFTSARFWTFFLAFFGLTGLIMRGLGILPGELLPLLTAIGMGLVAGVAVQTVVRRISRRQEGTVPGAADFVGKTGKVLVPVAPGDVGKVRVAMNGQIVDLIATTDEKEPMQRDEEVLVVEMRDSRAFVARLSNVKED